MVSDSLLGKDFFRKQRFEWNYVWLSKKNYFLFQKIPWMERLKPFWKENSHHSVYRVGNSYFCFCMLPLCNLPDHWPNTSYPIHWILLTMKTAVFWKSDAIFCKSLLVALLFLMPLRKISSCIYSLNKRQIWYFINK